MFPVEHRNTLNPTSNRLADTKDPLLPIINGDGAAPANFPATKDVLVVLTLAGCLHVRLMDCGEIILHMNIMNCYMTTTKT